MKESISDISIETFKGLLANSKNPSLLCGNGLSMNFEPQLGLDFLGGNMYKAHKHVILFSDYRVLAPKMKPVLLSNYKSTIRFLKKAIRSPKDLSELFLDAIDFAKSIITPPVIEWISNHKFDLKLVMGFGPLDYVTDLIKQAENNNSVFKVNYEFWTILIYFALVLVQTPSSVYSIPDKNKFIKAVTIGGEQSLELGTNNQPGYFAKVCENGMFTYLRLLLSTNILLVGNGYHVEQMSKWDYFQKELLEEFFQKFNNVLTTNYDLLIENLTEKRVYHLHGCYQRQRQIVLGQSLGIFVDTVRYDLSSILIGDYFIAKSYYATAAYMALSGSQNSKIMSHHKILEQVIVDQKSETFVIFGLNISNDYHIVRDLQTFLCQSGVSQSNIIFCYFSEDDKLAFKDAYEACITYSDEINEYVRKHISIYTIDSHKILDYFFVEKI